MNKQEIYEYLSQQHIWYEVTEHKAVYNMEDLSDVEILIHRQMPRIFLYVIIRSRIII